MKYILLPPLKLLWALFLTITMTLPMIAYLIVGLIWHFKIPEFGFFGDPIFNVSPYWTIKDDEFRHKYGFYFNSMYHYIWGYYN